MAVFADLPETLRISRIPTSRLPPDWRSHPAPERLAELGTSWVSAAETAILAVPSAVIPQELNYLLNPLHPQFKQIRVGRPEPFRFDPRLLKRSDRPLK
jgi:RES domain-containing protein